MILTIALRSRGIDLATLGVAYLVLLASVLATAATFIAARTHLVVSPNRFARDYGIYVSTVIATLLIAIVLENELLPLQPPALHVRGVAAAAAADGIAPVDRVPAGALGHRARRVVDRRVDRGCRRRGAARGHRPRGARHRAFRARVPRSGSCGSRRFRRKRGVHEGLSIYIGRKKRSTPATTPQQPWLGLPQWVALLGASVLLAIANSLLRGRGPRARFRPWTSQPNRACCCSSPPLVCAVPAVSYWLTRKAWMPELTRFVWLVWIVVGFALTYGNYLSKPEQRA